MKIKSYKVNRKVRIALATQGLTIQDLAEAIGRSGTLVVFMFQGKHKGWEHRPKILRLLGLSKKDEAEVFCDPPEKPKSRRAA